MSAILAALRVRYPAPEWALFFEVANGTGSDARRRADAVAVNLYPSRGHAIHGFEIKTSRADWIRERDDAAKADLIARKCDYWWLVVSDAAIVKPGELPHGWGLLALVTPDSAVPAAVALRQVRAPDKGEWCTADTSVDRSFFAALARRSAESAASKGEIDAAVARTRAEMAAEYGRRLERAERVGIDSSEISRLREIVTTFEHRAGVQMTRYNAGHMGAVAGYLSRVGGSSLSSVLETAAERAEYLARETRQAAVEIAAAESRGTIPREVTE